MVILKQGKIVNKPNITPVESKVTWSAVKIVRMFVNENKLTSCRDAGGYKYAKKHKYPYLPSFVGTKGECRNEQVSWL